MEKSILMSDPMVRAIREGRKTVTRRVVKPQPPSHLTHIQKAIHAPSGRTGFAFLERHLESEKQDMQLCLCPYGNVGDRLWVKETWAVHFAAEKRIYPPGVGHCWGSPIYRATHQGGLLPQCEGFTAWKSSRFMPRWASRITLEITGVRVERVQDISEDDARREGLGRDYLTARDDFAILWDILNKPRGFPWDSNPWVWVIDFKVIQPAA